MNEEKFKTTKFKKIITIDSFVTDCFEQNPDSLLTCVIGKSDWKEYGVRKGFTNDYVLEFFGELKHETTQIRLSLEKLGILIRGTYPELNNSKILEGYIASCYEPKFVEEAIIDFAGKENQFTAENHIGIMKPELRNVEDLRYFLSDLAPSGKITVTQTHKLPKISEPIGTYQPPIEKSKPKKEKSKVICCPDIIDLNYFDKLSKN